MNYPKRLIEVNLPIRTISRYAQNEKNIPKGHISTLHTWWARRPLASCRAVLCAALWLDPADSCCPQIFRNAVATLLCDFAEKVRSDASLAGLCKEHWSRWSRTNTTSFKADEPRCWSDMRDALLDFIADFANWDASATPAFLETAQSLTRAAYESLGGIPGTRPLTVDPFAGGGSIPLEALRISADTFASDLNPIAVLLNKVELEYIPRHGQRLANEVRKWGIWINDHAKANLADLYPKKPDGIQTIAYLWARTIQCEGPSCGTRIPLLRTNSLLKKEKKNISLFPDKEAIKNKSIKFIVTTDASPIFSTIRSASVRCPICDYTTPAKRVMEQLIRQNGAIDDTYLLALIQQDKLHGKLYNIPQEEDKLPYDKIEQALHKLQHDGYTAPCIEINPHRPSPNARGLSAVTRYGLSTFSRLYTKRQQLAILTFTKWVDKAIALMDQDIRLEAGSSLLLALGKMLDRNTSLCRWIPQNGAVGYTFGRQALPMIWDFVEINPLVHSGGWKNAYESIASTIENFSCLSNTGKVASFSATKHVLPDNAVDAFITDPPYYDAIPYADLSDFFYVWLRKTINSLYPDLGCEPTTPKEEEAIWNPGRLLSTNRPKDKAFYESQMQKALAEGCRITQAEGIGVVVFAHKSTDGWEALLQALLNAGWIVTASWPIDTERAVRTNAIGTASLTSSIHLVCRPRKNPDGSLRSNDVGDWRDVLRELPERIHEWMPRLAAEGIVGADAIFACLGPALEIFSRYSSVERADGKQVTLREYLEYVWAAVSKEALTMIFQGADTSNLEPDARLTAMWLWTLSTGETGNGKKNGKTTSLEFDEGDDDEETSSPKQVISGYTLEFDAARKIAQGLGIYLDKLTTLVEIKGSTARLRSVMERGRFLFEKDTSELVTTKPRKREMVQQLTMFSMQELETEIKSNGNMPTFSTGKTMLDRLHQSMLLFAAGHSEALRGFLREEGIGTDPRFWRLAVAFSSLYPHGSEERRWVDGVQSYKKGLGL